MMMTAFNSACRKIITAGWHNAAGGDVDSPVGHIALIDLPEAELPELLEAMGDELDHDEREAISESVNLTLLVVEDSYGWMGVVEYTNRAEAARKFEELHDAYLDWCES